jgi:plastocyanin
MKCLRSSEFTPWGVTFCRGLNRALHCYAGEPRRRVQVQSDGRGRKICPTVSQAGTYPYYCSVHPNRVGKVAVQ